MINVKWSSLCYRNYYCTRECVILTLMFTVASCFLPSRLQSQSDPCSNTCVNCSTYVAYYVVLKAHCLSYIRFSTLASIHR